MAVAIADSPHQTITPSCTRLLSPLLSWLSPSPTVHIRQSHHHVQGCSRRCSHGCRHRRQSTSDNHTIMYKVALAAALMAVAIADSPHQTVKPSCTRLLSPLLSWLSPSPTRSPWPTPRPPPITSPLPTRRRSSPLSLSPMSTESLMTTARPTSRRPRARMATALSLEASRLLFPTAESRPPPTPLTTTMDSSLMSPTREPPSTPQSPRRDTAMLPLPTSPPLLMPPPPLTSPLPKKLSSGI